MARIHMVNQKGSANNGLGAWMIVALIFSIGAVSMITQSAKAADPAQCSVIGATEDNLLSPEMAEYMVLFKHEDNLEEWDMD